MNASPEQAAAVILAGGLGTRIRHLLPDVPKPMAPVTGRPFLEWVARYLARAGVKRMIISSGYKAEVVARHFDAQPVPGVRVTCVAETQPLGTAGGFLNAVRGAEATPFWLVLNGDSLALANLPDLFAPLNDPDVSGVLLGIRMADAARYGTLVYDADKWLVGFQEKKPGAGVISAGVYILRASLLSDFPRQSPLSFEKDVFPSLAADRKRFKVCVAEAPFIDIGTPETLPLAERFLSQNSAFFL